MKKIFSKFDKNEKLESHHHNTSAKETNSNFLGKVFTVGRVTVTIEDVLAEGKSKVRSNKSVHLLNVSKIILLRFLRIRVYIVRILGV